jgi:hypothetical protein
MATAAAATAAAVAVLSAALQWQQQQPTEAAALRSTAAVQHNIYELSSALHYAEQMLERLQH